MSIRSLTVWLHRWAGLAAGLIILVLAATGGIMAFAEEMERATSPASGRAENTFGDSIPLDTLVAKVLVQNAGKQVLGVRMPGKSDGSLKVVTSDRQTYHLDPRTGETLAVRPLNAGFMRAITELHLNLMLQKTGSWIVRVATLLTLALALSGLWLWWPRQILRITPGSNRWRLTFDLHNIAALYSSLFLVLVTVTGTTMAFGRTADAAIRRWTGAPAAESPPPSKPAHGAISIPLSQVVRTAEGALPGASVVSFGIPPGRRAPYRVQMKFPEDHTPGGRSVVYLDQFSGEVSRIDSTRGLQPGNWYVAFQHSLHTGEIFGLPTKVLASLVCLALALQVLSGFVLWWRPKARRT